MLIRISPDGGEVVHLYDDTINQITNKHSDVRIDRATNVFFDNVEKMWKIKMLVKGYLHGVCLPESFVNRADALEYEKIILEDLMREHKV